MTLLEISKRIDKSKENESDVDYEGLSQIFDLEIYWLEQNRLKAYWVGNWYCTDSWVGYRMYFFDGEPVAFSIQKGRKCDESIRWFSKALALVVKEYLISCAETHEPSLSLCDINEDIGESYKIHFNGQILTHMARPTLGGEKIKILNRVRYENDYGIDEELNVELPNGEKKIINVKCLDFLYYLDEEDK